MSAVPDVENARAPRSERNARPPSARTSPAQTDQGGRSPAAIPAPIIVICTAPKSRSAPTPAEREKYAKEKAAAYANRAAAEGQLPPRAPPPPRQRKTSARAPEARRRAVKLAASAVPPPSAARHNSEFAAKATSAAAVARTTRIRTMCRN